MNNSNQPEARPPVRMTDNETGRISYGPPQPAIDAIAREAAERIFPHSEWYASQAERRIDIDSAERIIAAAIRRALKPVSEDFATARALERGACEEAIRQRDEAKSERDAAVNALLDLKRTNQTLAKRLDMHTEAICPEGYASWSDYAAMLREQIRVADAAYQHLHGQFAEAIEVLKAFEWSSGPRSYPLCPVCHARAIHENGCKLAKVLGLLPAPAPHP